MIESLRVRNYRVFDDLCIDGFRRVNLIAGRNNAGKTTLLEALFLLSFGHPSATLTTVINRGMVSSNLPPNAIPDVHWKQMFAMLDRDRAIEIEANHFSLGRLRLRFEMAVSDSTEVHVRRGDEGFSIGNVSDRMLKATLSRGQNDEHVRKIVVTDTEIHMERREEPMIFPVGFMPSGGGSLAQDAEQLGEIKKQKRDHLVVDALRTIAPKLSRLEIVTSTGTPMIWGDIGLSELIPLPALGEGMMRIARLALLLFSGGRVVLVDEIENGLHHSILPQLWRFIEHTARQLDLQVFATTHSFECVQAAQQSLNADHFRLHRLEVDEDGSNHAVSYEPEAIEAAIRHHLEVR